MNLQLDRHHYGEDLMSDKGGSKHKPTAYNRVAALRRVEGLSRTQMAKALGVNQDTLAHIEREEREPGVLLAWRIARHFELPLELVFSDKPLPTLAQILRDLHAATSHSQTGRG